MTTGTKRRGRPKGNSHSNSRAAWRVALCATIATDLVNTYGVKIPHAARAAKLAMSELDTLQSLKWVNIEPDAIKQIYYRQKRGKSVPIKYSPAVRLHAMLALDRTKRP